MNILCSLYDRPSGSALRPMPIGQMFQQPGMVFAVRRIRRNWFLASQCNAVNQPQARSAESCGLTSTSKAFAEPSTSSLPGRPCPRREQHQAWVSLECSAPVLDISTGETLHGRPRNPGCRSRCGARKGCHTRPPSHQIRYTRSLRTKWCLRLHKRIRICRWWWPPACTCRSYPALGHMELRGSHGADH